MTFQVTNCRTGKLPTALKVAMRREEEPVWEWGVARSREFSYRTFFAEIEDIAQLNRKIMQRDGEVNALDLMGYGDVFRGELFVSKGLAIALSDIRDNTTKCGDKQRNISLIEGNVLRRSTWNKMKKWLRTQKIEDRKFNLILSRPVGGFETLTSDVGVHFLLLQRAYQLLGLNGKILTQISPRLEDSSIRRWIKSVNQTQGLMAKYSINKDPDLPSGVISLTKLPDAPQRLPFLTRVEMRYY